ncbi:MAG: ATP-binding protein [Tetragenococcus halophilus]|nr:ATP-binding protein [Tetragenococcus koreensis]MDN6152405.1 ATP-binding protein [Tetragenococcus halophilus]MDN6571654.1 ATP-binding protein [Staphylococcus equorum]MDN6728061.1 ATP-binding protein [Tetragenococcus halophilus]MDN6735885.1 ATP-binding protein [Tetragenococcus koreensis]
MRKNVLNYLPDLVKASFNNDNNTLESVVLSIIRLLTKNDDTEKVAEKLSELLSEHQAGLYPDQKVTRFYQENNSLDEVASYVYRKKPSKTLSNLILNQDTFNRIDDVIMSYNNRKRLEKLGIQTTKKIILNGPPGTGKSSIGEALAYELDLEFLLVSIPALFSSYLGDSGKNITNLFTSLSSKNAIIVFDEFDSIAVSRSTENDVGEMRRIVNSVLTSLDAWHGEGLIIATTNDKANLDSAAWRRFDEKIDVGLPEKENRVKLWDWYSKQQLMREELQILADLSQGFSPAEIEIYSQQGLRLKVIKGKAPFLTILEQLAISSLGMNKKQFIVQYLKNTYPELTTRNIGDLLNISKSSVQRYLKGGD